jgi:hypothetical protein
VHIPPNKLCFSWSIPGVGKPALGFPSVEWLSRAAQRQIVDFASLCRRAHQSSRTCQILSCWRQSRPRSLTTSFHRGPSLATAQTAHHEVADGKQKV